MRWIPTEYANANNLFVTSRVQLIKYMHVIIGTPLLTAGRLSHLVKQEG